ncbi:CRISPR-associated protein Csx18, partial [Planktothrix sp.]|uniref:CRISPR-associated protein Csx18 n=1 Tax=Planktothrix sp. TaxID=3088171 RepID=UPI0038D4016B
MSISLTRILVRYRILSVAIANAAITWTILIIAPLGLFAVIVCTLAVFISSAIMGWLGDQA